jgi:hypothetical protein
MNEKWHAGHPLPKNATIHERVSWHAEHARQCACRPMPEAIEREITRRDRSR